MILAFKISENLAPVKDFQGQDYEAGPTCRLSGECT